VVLLVPIKRLFVNDSVLKILPKYKIIFCLAIPPARFKEF